MIQFVCENRKQSVLTFTARKTGKLSKKIKLKNSYGLTWHRLKKKETKIRFLRSKKGHQFAAAEYVSVYRKTSSNGNKSFGVYIFLFFSLS